jgi:hypothetical protein
MKQLIPIFSLAFLMTACVSNPNTSAPTSAAPQVQQAPTYNPDTIGLSQFQQWKAANELADIKEFKAPAAPVKKAKRVYSAPVAHTSNQPASTETNTSSTVPNDEEGTVSSESSNTAKAPEKKGWSKAAKGTAIGVGTGAVAGAVIGKKNRVVGGVIGGVVGGAVGYGIGRHIDKKEGRY